MKTLIFIFSFTAAAIAGATPEKAARELVATDVLTTESINKPTLAGGSSVIVGGDTMDERLMTAWFYGTEPVKTCYNHLESFGVAEKAAADALKSAVATWQKYFREKQISGGKEARAVNTNFQLLGKCKGDEDLVIHFGTGPIFGNMRDLKIAEGLHNPVAYVNKTHLAKDSAWSKGYVRFVPRAYYSLENFPDWSVPDSLKTMLVHELGHVLGFVHEPNSIMDGAIIQKVFLSKDKTFTAEVDQRQELVTCGDCDARFVMLKNSTTPTAAQKFLQKLGFTLATPILLTKTKGVFTLSQGDRRYPLEHAKETITEHRAVLHTNFPDSVRREKETIMWNGSLQGTAALIVYNGNAAGAQGILQLHYLNVNEEAAILDFARDGK